MLPLSTVNKNFVATSAESKTQVHRLQKLCCPWLETLIDETTQDVDAFLKEMLGTRAQTAKKEASKEDKDAKEVNEEEEPGSKKKIRW